MALVKCPECGKKISIEADFCPNCGCKKVPREAPSPSSLWLYLVVGAGLVWILAKAFHNGPGQPESHTTYAPAVPPEIPVPAVQAPQPEPAKPETLGTASDKAWKAGILPLNAPFMRPYQYIGMQVAKAQKAVKGTINQGGNIVVDNDKVHLLLEVEGNFVN